jgi:hypothetical protein
LGTTNKELLDKVIDNNAEAVSIRFWTGFGVIVIKIGSYGLLYLLSFSEGILYKICE